MPDAVAGATSSSAVLRAATPAATIAAVTAFLATSLSCGRFFAVVTAVYAWAFVGSRRFLGALLFAVALALAFLLADDFGLGRFCLGSH